MKKGRKKIYTLFHLNCTHKCFVSENILSGVSIGPEIPVEFELCAVNELADESAVLLEPEELLEPEVLLEPVLEPEVLLEPQLLLEPEVLIEPVVSVEPERSRRIKTRVDYAALFNGDDNDKAKKLNKKSDYQTTDVSTKKVAKGKLSAKLKVHNSGSEQMKEFQETRESTSSLEAIKVKDIVLDMPAIKKTKSNARHSKSVTGSVVEKEGAAVVSDEEPEIVSSQYQAEPVADSNLLSSQAENPPSLETQLSNDVIQEESSDSTSRGSSIGQPERGRSRRGATAVSYKEPPLGKKLRQVIADIVYLFLDREI